MTKKLYKTALKYEKALTKQADDTDSLWYRSLDELEGGEEEPSLKELMEDTGHTEPESDIMFAPKAEEVENTDEDMETPKEESVDNVADQISMLEAKRDMLAADLKDHFDSDKRKQLIGVMVELRALNDQMLSLMEKEEKESAEHAEELGSVPPPAEELKEELPSLEDASFEEENEDENDEDIADLFAEEEPAEEELPE